MDGRFRKDCSSLRYTACDLDKPIRCPDGRCVETLIQCVSFLCSAHSPYKCRSNRCVANINDCFYSQNLLVIKRSIVRTVEGQFQKKLFTNDQSSTFVGSLFSKRKMKYEIEGVGFSEIENTVLAATTGTEELFSSFLGKSPDQLTPNDFILSPVFKIKGLSKFAGDSKSEAELKLQITMDYPDALNSDPSIVQSVASSEPLLPG